MPRIRFTHNFDFRMTKHAMRAYKAGREYLVSQACAKKALAEDKAVEVKREGENAAGR